MVLGVRSTPPCSGEPWRKEPILSVPVLDLQRPEHLADPYPLYRRLRRDAPLAMLTMGIWVVSRHADVTAILRDSRFGHGGAIGSPAPTIEPISNLVARWMLFCDPPAHGRLRGVVQHAFTAARIEAMRPRIRAIADVLLDAVADTGGMDVMRDFARPLPIAVICDMIGVPDADRETVVPSLMATVQALAPRPMTRRELDQANAAVASMTAYFGALLASRRRAPGDDLLSALAAGSGPEGRLDDDEIIANLALLFHAGFETTANLLGNGLLALHQQPEALAALRADPGLLPAAIDELTRFDAPVQLTARRALEPVELHGERIEAGEKIACLLGSANRDEAVHRNPDQLDWHRGAARAVAFGGGIHHCLGAQLARIEAQIGVARVIERLPGLRIVAPDASAWQPNATLRGQLAASEARPREPTTGST